MTQKTIMAVVALATGVAVAGTTTVSSVEDMPASGGEGTIRYTGATGTVTKDVTLTPAKNKAATLEVPADTTLTFSGKFDVSTGAFIKTGAGTVKLPYVGSYYLGGSSAGTTAAPLTWSDGNAVNGYGALTVADGTLEVGAPGATVNKVSLIAVGVRHDSAVDPMFKLVGGSMTGQDMHVDRGTSAGGKQVQPTVVVTGGASLILDNWQASAGGAADYANNGVVTVTGAGSKLGVTGYHTASSVPGTQTLNVTDGGTFQHTRNNMDYNTTIGFVLGGWAAGNYSGSENNRQVVNVDGGTFKAEAAYLYRFSEINVTGGGKVQLGRPIQNINHQDIDAQRGKLSFDDGTLGAYAAGVANWFCGIPNYAVGAGGLKIDLTSASVGALSGHATYKNTAAKSAGAEIVIAEKSNYVALGAGEVNIRAGASSPLHMTVNGRLCGSGATGRILPAEGKTLGITVAGDNTLQEMTFQPSGRTRFRHQGVEADIKRWATVGAAMPMPNGTLAIGHESELDHRGAVWLREKLPVNESFKISWTYYGVQTSANYPWGVAAVFQGTGLSVCGESSSGSSCGFKGIANSVAMAYDVQSHNLCYGVDGDLSDRVWNPDISSGWADDPIRLSLSYDAETKALTLKALKPSSGQVFTKTVTVDLAAKFGADAYFGFTGSTTPDCVGYHCIDDVRIDSETGRGYQKVGGHLELAADQTFEPEILADEKNLGVAMKELVYGANARLDVTPSSFVGLPSVCMKDVNLGFDAVRGTGTLVKGGAGALALSAPGAASAASVDVQAGGVVLRHEDLEEPPFSAADGDWCFTGPEIYWRGPHTLQFGPLGNGSKSGSGAIHTMNANTRRRYRVDGDWKVTFSVYGEAVYGDGLNQGFTFLVHNAAAGCEARGDNLCGGYGGSIKDNAAAFRFWTSSKFVTYAASSAWNASATADGSHAFENGVAFKKGDDPILIDLEHNAEGNYLEVTMTQGDKSFTYRWENADLKAKIGNQSLAYLSFGASGQSDNPMFFRISDFRFQYLDADPAVDQQPYFGTLTTSVANGLEVTLDAARANLSYRLADNVSLGAGSGIKVAAKRAAGTLDLGTVTCAGAASVTLADGCTASLAAATGTDDFTVSGDTLTITSPTAFTETTTLRLNDGAKLNLAFSGTLKVRRIYVDGVHQRSGNYTTGDADWIAGGTGHIEMGKGRPDYDFPLMRSVIFAGCAVLSSPLLATAPRQGVPAGCDPSVMSAAYWRIWNDAEQAKIDADIEANRKADAVFAVDAPEGAEVTVEQIEHEFRFGAHIFNFNQLGKTEWNDAYKASYGKGGLFNQATVSFYWIAHEPTPGSFRFGGDYGDTERYWNGLTREEAMQERFWRRPAPGPVIDFLKVKDVRIHGHILVWGYAKPYWIYDWYCPEDEKRAFDALGIPRHSQFLAKDAGSGSGFMKRWREAWRQVYGKVGERELEDMAPVYAKNLRRLFRKRVVDVANAYGDVLDSWDVVNESSEDWRRYRKSRTGLGYCFSVYGLMPGDYQLHALLDAKEAISPKAKLCINDWNMKSDFLDQVKDLEAEGAKIDVVGCQMHLFSTNDCMRLAKGETEANWVGTPQMISDRLDLMAKTGRPLHVSEVTISAPGVSDRDRMIQAVLARNIYRAWFAHPKTMGITWWNTVDGGGVKGEPLVSGLFTRDLQKKPVYYALDQLINREWRTNLSLAAKDGKVAFRGFRGRYRLSWTGADGKLMSEIVEVR